MSRILERMRMVLVLAAALICAYPAHAQRRRVLIDQDGDGPGGTNQLAMIMLLQAPNVDVLGITIMTGDGWRDANVQHTLRMLEMIGRTSVPVVPGAEQPMVRTREATHQSFITAGRPRWLGAWGRADSPLVEGVPTTKPLAEDVATFIVRQVRAHPGEVTIYAAGPLTNIARALVLEPRLVSMTRGIVIMGGSIAPATRDIRYLANSRFEFNFWFDPEAAHAVLSAPWPRIDVIPVDASVRASFSRETRTAISRATSPVARYVNRYFSADFPPFDELAAAAWLESTVTTRVEDIYMDVDVRPGVTYGHTLTWSEGLQPEGVRKVRAHLDVDVPRFNRLFAKLVIFTPRQPARAPRPPIASPSAPRAR